MGLNHLSFDMDAVPGVEPRQPLFVGATEVFRRLLDVFSPRAFLVSFDDFPAFRLERMAAGHEQSETPPWFDEEAVVGEILTRCSAGPTAELISALGDRLSRQPLTELLIVAEGPLLHQAPDGDTAWYGRWKVFDPPVLLELVRVQLEWSREAHAFALTLPFEGYPMTSTRLRADGGVGDADAAVAFANRAAIIPVLRRVPDALGLEPTEVEWTDGGDWDYRYPEDAHEIRDVWLPRLRAAGPP
jgi:hypothetical protein